MSFGQFAGHLEQRVEVLEMELAAIKSAQAQQGISAILLRLEGKIDKMAHTLDDTLAAVTAEGTKIDGLVALTNGLEQQLKDALAGVTLPPGVQAKIDAVFDGVTNNATKVQAAIDAGTPPVPPAPAPAP